MEEEHRHPENSGKGKLDPEPVSIALGFLGAVASIGAVFFQKAIDDDRDERQRREYVRNSLYSLHRALVILEGTLKTFASYAEQYDFWNSDFRLGQVHFWVDQTTLLEIRKIYSDIYTSGMALNESAMILAGHLDNEDFALTARYAQEVDELIFGAMQSDTYRSFMRRSSRLINRLNNLVNGIGRKYGFSPPEVSYQ